MVLRPPLLRPVPLQSTSTVCLRCLRKLSRAAPLFQRLLSTTTSAKDAAATSRAPRNAFKREYFWANASLEDVIAGAKRSVWNTAVPGQQTSKEQTIGDSAIEELPHRRRKRLRDEAASGSSPSKDTELRPDASSRLSDSAQALPTDSLRRRFATYLSLSKPHLSFLIVLTTAASYALYPVPAVLAPSATFTPSLSTLTLLFLSSGTALCSASANALNMLMEPAHDAKMSRTRNRPLVRGLIKPRGAFAFAALTATVGLAALYYGVNPTTAFLGGLNIFLYAGCYTPLKRVSVINTWVGAIVGGIPPLMGWTAAAGQCASHGGTWQELLLGPDSIGGWLAAALLFAWQFPHFNALSWTIREEYKNAGYRMLAWTNPARNARVALRYSLLMFPVCIGLAVVGVTDWGFAVTSSAINGWMTWEAYRFWRYEGQKGTARGLFWASVWHLPIVLVLAMAHKKGLWERVWNAVTGKTAMGDDDEDWEYEDEKVEPIPLVSR
ncbi:mitochondria protoheme IX farnesyltransferase [Saccharata proteae CBS 121410]|uniref:Protoheme IX farnesyltransferase, mitochondrial n=1 Tax=Saccharata proteae CBS 121410 TaxID=1314787 RepID=A0A9P4HR76_9PEZI|nr:mitochondria protoheme IX farnesyltransferase [Saccharata proteae CBS 121410]